MRKRAAWISFQCQSHSPAFTLWAKHGESAVTVHLMKLEIIGPPTPTHVASGAVLRSHSVEATYNKEPVLGKETRWVNGFGEYECSDSQM